MRVTREVTIGVSPGALWTLLWDVPRMVACVPGCVEAREVETHRRYAARLTQKVGPISLSVPLDVEVTEVEPERHLALRGRGRDSRIGAEIVLRMTLDLEARGAESVLRIDAEGRVLGALGALGQGAIQRKAEESVDEFVSRLREAAGG